MSLLAHALLAALAALPTLPVFQNGGTDVQGAAPANRWHTHGGGVARSGASRTEPVRQPVEVAWRHEAGGQIEGEPLVWDDWILLTIRRSPELRVLRAIDLLNGAPLLPDHIVRSKLPLEPSIWRNVVVFRAGENQLMGLRLGTRRFDQVWSWRSDEALGPPLVVGSDVYVCVGDTLSRLAVGRSRPTWEALGRFRGRVSLLGDMAHVIGYDAQGKAFLRGIDQRTGTVRSDAYVGHHGGRVPEQTSSASVHVLPSGHFVSYSTPLEIVEGREIHFAGFSAVRPRRSSFEPLPGSMELIIEPAAWGEHWLGAIVDGEGKRTFILKNDPDDLQLRVLATPDSNPDFLPDRVPVTTAGQIGFVGARAFDLESSRVLWRLPIDATSRTIPARETVLVVEQNVRLTAIRSSVGRGGSTNDARAPELVESGRLVLRDGSMREGDFAVDLPSERVALVDARSEQPWHMEDVLLLEDSSGQILLGNDVVRGVRALVEVELARIYGDLARKAKSTNDPDLMDELLRAAWLAGADESGLDTVQKAVDSLRQRPGVVRRSRSDEIRAEAQRAEGIPAEAYWSHVRALGGEVPDRWLVGLLGATLEAEPGHGPAREFVRSLLPEEIRPATIKEGEASDWLAFVEATRRSPVRILHPPASESDSMDDSVRLLGRATQVWREDLLGFESEHLLILTPVRRPGALARCLSMGELVCEALGEIFEAGDVERDSRRPLVLHLYGSRDEYLRFGPDGGGEGGAGLSWTAGHYDQSENVSRIFVPEHAGGFSSVMETYAHELTHHWLRMQCPMFPFKPLERRDVTQPGFWIVEGFASLVDEFRFDLQHGTWHHESPQSRRLDLVANATKGQGLPWKDVYGLSHMRFAEMPSQGEPAIPSTCYLGLRHVVSSRHMFYAQAASTARYLFEADEGRQREALLAYVTAFYTGDQGGLDVKRAFGVGPEELGKQVTEWSRRSLGMGAGRGR